MDAGHLRREGGIYEDDAEAADGQPVNSSGKTKTHELGSLYVEVTDAAGETVVQRAVAKTKKELQKELKDLEKEFKPFKKKGLIGVAGGDRSSRRPENPEDQEHNEMYWALEDKINEMKAEIAARVD